MVFLVVVLVMCFVVFSVLVLLRLVRCCAPLKNRHLGIGKGDGQLQFVSNSYTEKL